MTTLLRRLLLLLPQVALMTLRLLLPQVAISFPTAADPCTMTVPVNVTVPFAAAALHAISLRRLRLVAQWSGVSNFPQGVALPIGGEKSGTGENPGQDDGKRGPAGRQEDGDRPRDGRPEDWGSDDPHMVEPLLYAIRNAKQAIRRCEETFKWELQVQRTAVTSGKETPPAGEETSTDAAALCKDGVKFEKRLAYFEQLIMHQAGKLQELEERTPDRHPRIPKRWTKVFQLFYPEIQLPRPKGKKEKPAKDKTRDSTSKTGLASLLEKMGPSLVHLFPEDKNGAPETCQVKVPSNIDVGGPEEDRVPRIEIAPDVKMPLLGLGTGDSFQTVPGVTDRLDGRVAYGYPDPANKTALALNEQACVTAVAAAFELGYRYVDTAQDYGTEACIRKAIKQALEQKHIASRKDLFIATKLSEGEGEQPKSHRKSHVEKLVADRPQKALTQSLKTLGLEYVDLYMQHHPWIAAGERAMLNVWQKMETLFEKNKVRALGGGSHGSEVLGKLAKVFTKGGKSTGAQPRVGYEKFDVFKRASEKEMARVWKRWKIFTVATGAVHGTPYELSCLTDPIVAFVANRLSKTPPQICIRFVLQHGLGVLAKSRRRDRLEENLRVFDFEIPDAEMQILNGLVHGVWWDEVGISEGFGRDVFDYRPRHYEEPYEEL